MIRVRQDGVERQLTYDEFVREVRSGRITGSTMVLSDVLTSGVWKPAIELQFFRSWAPTGSVPSRPAAPPVPPETPSPEVGIPGGPVRESPERTRTPPSTLAEEEGAPRAVDRASQKEAATIGPDDVVRIPWEQQDRIGFFRGLYGTIRLAFDDGAEYARRIAAGEMVMPSLVFGIVITAITAIFDAAYGIGALRVTKDLLEQMETQSPGLFGRAGPPTARDILFLEGIRILFFPLTMFVWAGFVHLLVRLFGRPAKTFHATFRVASYAMAPTILNILPVCGVLIGVIWMIVLTIRGLVVVQRTSVLASILAVLLPALGYLLWMGLANEGMLQVLPHLGGSG